MCSCAAPAHLISADVSLWMAGAGGEGAGEGAGEAGFTLMGSGRCWTMAETKERFERRTSKKKKKVFPLSIQRELRLIHHGLFLPLCLVRS